MGETVQLTALDGTEHCDLPKQNICTVASLVIGSVLQILPRTCVPATKLHALIVHRSIHVPRHTLQVSA